MRPHELPLNEPEIVYMSPQKMAAVYAWGLPGEALPRVLPALYSSLMALKFDRSVKGEGPISIEGIRARFPDAHRKLKDDWTTVIGVPVPDDITSIPQQIGGDEIKVEVWEYGTVAQILHDGREHGGKTPATILKDYISEHGYHIIGVYEEEYFSGPERTIAESIIRYRVQQA